MLRKRNASGGKGPKGTPSRAATPPAPAQGGEGAERAPITPGLTKPASAMRVNQEPVKYDFIGPTMVATIIDHDLTAPKVADLTVELEAKLQKSDTVRNLVVDLQNVEYLDSSCLYMLVHLLEKVKENGGLIAVARAQHRVEGIFKLTRLGDVFPIKPSVPDAIKSIEKAAA